MNAVVAIIVSALVYPGLIFALVAAALFGWIRGSARAATLGWPGVAPLASMREVTRRMRQSSTVPEGVIAPVIQALPVLAVIFPLLVLMFLPLPANRGMGADPYTADVAALGALLFGMPLARIALGWITPSPYTRVAAMRSARQLIGYALPLALALAVAATISVSTRVATDAVNHALASSHQMTLANIARIMAGIAYAACLPALARLTPIREGQGALELVGNELTELSGRELLVMRLAEWLQFVAAIGLGLVLFVLPFFQNDVTRGLVAIAGAIIVAAGLGIWEGGIAPRLRTREDATAPYGIWLGTPTFLGIIAVLLLVLAPRFA